MKFRWEQEFKETPIGNIPEDWGVRGLGLCLGRHEISYYREPLNGEKWQVKKKSRF